MRGLGGGWGYLGLVPQAVVVQQHSLLLAGEPPQVSLKLLRTKAINNVKLDAIFPVDVSKGPERKYQLEVIPDGTFFASVYSMNACFNVLFFSR